MDSCTRESRRPPNPILFYIKHILLLFSSLNPPFETLKSEILLFHERQFPQSRIHVSMKETTISKSMVAALLLGPRFLLHFFFCVLFFLQGTECFKFEPSICVVDFWVEELARLGVFGVASLGEFSLIIRIYYYFLHSFFFFYFIVLLIE